MLAFSFLRNAIQLNMQPRALRTSIYEEQKDSKIPESRRMAKHLSVFNGLKAASAILLIWGQTFFFSWYSIVNNPDQVAEMRKDYAFNFVTGTLFCVPLFFFCSGFLQTYSFVQRDKRESLFVPKNLAKYYLTKLLRFVPLNLICLLFVVYILPFLGSGPVWRNYATLMQPCNSKWWTNALWINNVYPLAYDDKCLPWTWFVPCYV
mmetsp:Transcript_7393/g.12482  ORF Transcript_7393/g.12482 Transcript_7393/m.12482 type:complete len:206 (+) Transcript_7393:791-1408(+)